MEKAKEVAGSAAKKAEPVVGKAKSSAGGFFGRIKRFFSGTSDDAK
jgi:hypothetical protein